MNNNNFASASASTSSSSSASAKFRFHSQGLILGLGFILLFIVALFSGSSILYLLVYLSIGFFLYPILKIRRALTRIQGRVEPEQSIIFVGEPLQLTWTLESSPGFLPLWVRLELQGSPGLRLAENSQEIIPEQGIREGKIELIGLGPGKYHLNRLQIITTDPLGLFTFQRSFQTEKIIRVYPQLRPRSIRGFFSGDGEAIRQGTIPTHNPQGDMLGMRPWRPGDSIKQIHWKQSLRHDKLFMKEFNTSDDAEITLLLNRNMRDAETSRLKELELNHWVKETSCSLAYQFIEAGTRLRLVSQEAPQNQVATSTRDLVTIFDLILDMTFKGTQSFEDLLLVQKGLSQSYFLITPWLTDSLTSAIQKCKAYTPRVVVFVPDTRDKELGQRIQALENQGIPVILDSLPPKAFFIAKESL